MKSNKSYMKRLRVTRSGKVIGRAPGHNHFNAKRSGKSILRRRRSVSLTINASDRSRFLS